HSAPSQYRSLPIHCSHFHSRMPRPPSPTLFPYTTLFRSKPLVRATARRGADAEIGGFGGLFDLKRAGFSDPVLVAATRTGSEKPDRKSTRLNSSHLVISYAVFCLKKKKQKYYQPILF